jgi:hypothetical protein
MASQSNQVVAPSAMKLVLPITGGSSYELANKRQKKEAYIRVQHVGVQGPFIRRHTEDVFAWTANDLYGVNRDIIEHSLNVDLSFRPRKQRLRKMSDDKAKGARNDVKRLLSVGVIREVTYLEWLANTVMLKKANGKWRMCIDFTDLNKACSKDEFPLPRLDSLVDAAATSELMSLLDCYSGYHQIWMKKDDEPKTSFITPSGTYCYLRMPEGLKNAGGSFSRMTAKVLHSQIGRNV